MNYAKLRQSDTVYLSGPMSGLPEHNFPAFAETAQRLRAKGWTVVNPAELGEHANWSHDDYLRRDVAEMMRCTYLAQLPGWSSSRGALIEWKIAELFGLGYVKVPSPDLDGLGVDGVDLPGVDIDKIKYLAEGGVVTKPTLAMIGEGGESEAVVPLSKAGGMGFGGAGVSAVTT